MCRKHVQISHLQLENSRFQPLFRHSKVSQHITNNEVSAAKKDRQLAEA